MPKRIQNKPSLRRNKMSKKHDSKDNLWESISESSTNTTTTNERVLSSIEKTFLLQAERGDCGTVRRIIEEYSVYPDEFDINCVDPLDRTALITAIENENIELIKLLLEENIKVHDALLHAIKEEYVEAVEVLLNWEEEHHKEGEPYSWEKVDRSTSSFTADITPLILAAHKNNYEIIKILLDRGATLPVPHDVRCGCDICVTSSSTDSLRHSQARINAYRALISPSLIALSSNDPVLTAFELSWELRRLSRMETEFRAEYNEMRKHVQEFATALVDHARTSVELEIMLNYDHNNPSWISGERQILTRLKLAIKYKQKEFVAHPNVQQLLAAIWYEGLPGFRRKNIIGQFIQIVKFSVMFPIYCLIYMLAPHTKMGAFMKKPFVKFICHSGSYMFFLFLLGAASQRVEIIIFEQFGTTKMQNWVARQKKEERGAFLGYAEYGVVLYVISLIWGEIRSLWYEGLKEYISNLWNIVDFITNVFYLIWFALRCSSWYITQYEERVGKNPWYPREEWSAFEPKLISEGAFAAGMIFSFLKLVHIFSINPYLGPLQISLSRMILDIVKFLFIYTLVLFAFGCGLNQLLWYYAELEKNKCYHLPDDQPDFENNDKACSIWRRYANLFETSQSLFWASFGLVDLMSFELTGIKSFTRFWALLMFGSYCVINIIVLLNMLIAMMSNSYQIISERADVEWKFARSKLWISYFDESDTLPPPFNIFPNMKMLYKIFGCNSTEKESKSFRFKSKERVQTKYREVMRLLVRRYVTAEQRKRDEFGINEDDVMEIRQDISSLRYELIDILNQNGMKTPRISLDDIQISGKKVKIVERRILNDFHIGIVEHVASEMNRGDRRKDSIFEHIARAVARKSTKKYEWNALMGQNSLDNPIGSRKEADEAKRKRQSLRKQIVSHVDRDRLLERNEKLDIVSPVTRKAYYKFLTNKVDKDAPDFPLDPIVSDEENKNKQDEKTPEAIGDKESPTREHKDWI